MLGTEACQGHAVAEQSACVLCAESTSLGLGNTGMLGLKADIVIWINPKINPVWLKL